MSTFVLQNDAMIFGSQSPFNKYITEPGVKEVFFRYIGDRNSRVLLKRGFKTFLLMNKIFPDSKIEINENVKFGLSQLISPLMKYAIANDVNSIMKLDKSKFTQGEIAITNEIQKATKVKNTAVVIMDSEKEHLNVQQGITTYILKKISSCSENEIKPTWDNKFFSFENAADICLTIVIPKQYLANVMVCEFANFKEKGTIGSSADNITYKGKIIDKLTVDLVKSFFTAIYGDCYRSRINGDIYNLDILFKNEGQNIVSCMYSNNLHDKKTEQALYTKYANLLKKFKSPDNENLIFFMLDYIKFKNYLLVNPLEFYKGFIDIPYNQIETVFKRSPVFHRFDKENGGAGLADYRFSNNLADMDKFLIDNDRDILVYAIKLVRYLPYAIFNTYVVGNGSDHSKMVQLMSNLERILSTLNNAKGYFLTSNVIGFLFSELDFIKNTLFKDFSSPLNVSGDARSIITSAIQIYGLKASEKDKEKMNE